MRQMGRLPALLLMLAGTAALALLANQFFGLLGLLITAAIGLLITAWTLRL